MIYFIQTKETKTVKIGFSSNNTKNRLKSIQTGNSEKLKLILEINGERKDEKFLHYILSKYKLNGEWFKSTEVNKVIGCLRKCGSVRVLSKLLKIDDIYNSFPIISIDKTKLDEFIQSKLNSKFFKQYYLMVLDGGYKGI